jgi:hypothetical protein
MSAHGKPFHVQIDEAIDAVQGRTLPNSARFAAFGGILWGVIALCYGLIIGSPEWTWGAVLATIVWAIGMCQGGVMIGVIFAGTRARWGRPLKRIAESFFFYLPVLWVFLAVFLVGGMQIYEWYPGTTVVAEPVALAPHMEGAANAKEFWLLTAGGWFFRIRMLLAVALLIGLDWIHIRASLRADLVKAKDRLGSASPAWWGTFTGGASDPEAAAEQAIETQHNMVPVMAFAYAVIMSLIAFDLVMSLDVWWFSNMFGGWIFMSSIWLALATTAAFTMLGRDWLNLQGWVTATTTLDLGKLMLAGCMFWAYTLFAQILPIWYTNVPEETNFLLVRMMLPEWSWLARTVAVMCFLAPFTILLSRGLKKMRWPFFTLASLIMLGLFLERSLLVMPSVWRDQAFPMFDFLFVNFGILAGVLGGFVLVVGSRIAQLPAVPVGDPFLEDHPWDVHVHASHPHSAHGH